MQGAELRHHAIPFPLANSISYTWTEERLIPFDELVISWEGERPSQGGYRIAVSIWTCGWSDWLDYAYWGANAQYTCLSQDKRVAVVQDTVEVSGSIKGQGVRVRILAEGGASLNALRRLHLSSIDRELHSISADGLKSGKRSLLNVPSLSQMALNDIRNSRLCSPTSLSACLRFLLSSHSFSPLKLADEVFDQHFHIYGNWTLNVAQASHYLGREWTCLVARLSSFQPVVDLLESGFPVVISLKGPLKGAASSYAAGHLLVIRGFDPDTKQVLCMDPAFDSDEQTLIQYDLGSLIEAWNRRKGMAYLFWRNR